MIGWEKNMSNLIVRIAFCVRGLKRCFLSLTLPVACEISRREVLEEHEC